MGFFTSKVNCDFCNKEIGLNRYKIVKDNCWICPNCLKKAGGISNVNCLLETKKSIELKIFKNEIILCNFCKKEKIKRKDIICENCKNYMIINSRFLQDNINKFSDDIERGYKHVEPYLSRYKLILEQYKTTYEYAKYLPNLIKLDPPTYEEAEKKYLDKIKNKIDEMKIIIIHKLDATGEVTYLRSLKKLRDEILEAQIKYPEFIDALTIDDIQEVLE